MVSWPFSNATTNHLPSPPIDRRLSPADSRETERDFEAVPVGSRAASIARLRKIQADFRVNRRVPLLQIETHGHADEGIGVSEDDWLTWPELMVALTPLNQATSDRLPIVLAPCHGIWDIKMAQPMERSPFMALIGPKRDVYPGEVVRC
jgi:hypothetical protein